MGRGGKMRMKSSVFCLVLTALVVLNSCRNSDNNASISSSGNAPSKVAKTGQTDCYDDAGAVISCETTTGQGQDGALQVGVAWPSQRFADNRDQTIADHLTNLIWSQDGTASLATCGTGTNKTWQGALDYIGCLNANNYLGYGDWRLPNVNELYSLINFGQINTSTWLVSQGFVNVQSAYWSSTSANFPGPIPSPNDDIFSIAKAVDFEHDTMASSSKTTSLHAWPVRGGQPAILPKTGQKSCYDAAGDVISCATLTGQGQDGALQIGVEWPSPRFTDNGDQTITDNLTNLIWAQDVWAHSSACGTSAYTTWQGALDFTTCANANSYLGYNDWRMPNVNELNSLLNYGEKIDSAWLASQGFIDVQVLDHYSTSTSAMPNLTCDLNVLTDINYVNFRPKTESYTLWLVRGGR